METFRTQAGETSLGVGAGSKRTQIWRLGALVNIFAGFLMEIIARWADTSVGAVQIQTRPSATCVWVHDAFVYICTQSSVQTKFVAIVAHAEEVANSIDALAVATQTPLS